MAGSKPSYEELKKKLEDEARRGRRAEALLKKTKIQQKHCLDQLHNMGRKLSWLRSTIDMPELNLDKDWNIVGYTNNFLAHTDLVIEFAEQKKNLRDFLRQRGHTALSHREKLDVQRYRESLDRAHILAGSRLQYHEQCPDR